MVKKIAKTPVDECPQNCDQLVEENNFLLHTLIDLLIEKELITKEELQDKLDNIESEMFVEELEEKGKQPKSAAKKKRRK